MNTTANTTANTTPTTIRLEDGRVFPVYDGKPLAWSVELYFTDSEARLGYPRLRAVLRAMRQERPEQLAREVFALKRASLDSMFGRVAQRCLDVVNSEITGDATTTPPVPNSDPNS